MLPRMKREQFNAMELEELVEWAYENIDYVHHEDALIELAKHEIDEENLNIAIHILTGIYESEEAIHGYYIYDRCMGTLEPVVPITCKEDLEEYIDFEEDEEGNKKFTEIKNIFIEMNPADIAACFSEFSFLLILYYLNLS